MDQGRRLIDWSLTWKDEKIKVTGRGYDKVLECARLEIASHDRRLNPNSCINSKIR